MKYLYSILAIILAASLLSLFFLWPDPKNLEKDVIFTINGQSYTREAVASQYSRLGYHSDNAAELIDTAISRELLIQEAQKQEIDKEPAFRSSLKNYYENSLIKILLDRRNENLQIEVTEKDIDRYISFLNTTVSFTRLDQIPKSDQDALSATGLSTSSLFDDLAMPVKLLLSSLSPGSFNIIFDTGNEQYALRLDKIEPAEGDRPTPDRENIRRNLSDSKREQSINEWYTELRNKASITIHQRKD